jgi:hypothetical protein
MHVLHDADALASNSYVRKMKLTLSTSTYSLHMMSLTLRYVPLKVLETEKKKGPWHHPRSTAALVKRKQRVVFTKTAKEITLKELLSYIEKNTCS